MSMAVATEESARAGLRRRELITEHAVIRAVRLGWYLAEVRGRAWWRGQRPATEALPPDADHPLPLRPQRTAAESRQQAVDTLIYLADELQVGESPTSTSAPDAAFAPRLLLLLPAADGTEQQAWPQLAELLYAWDSAIQDQLAARADILACAYLLGRGLCECYWALAPDDDQVCPDGTPAAGSWAYLFGPARRRELTRMAGRLGPYLDLLTPVAISGSLEAWGCVAADPAWRGQPDARPALYEQLRRWYQLLVLGQNPATLVRPTALLHARSTTVRLARAFWPQLLLGVASVAVVGAFVLLLTTKTGGAFTQTLLAVIGTVGVGASTLAAKAKNATQSLLARLRQEADSDLVALEVTSVPVHPRDAVGHPGRRSVTHRSVERAVAARTLAVPVP